MNKHCKSSDQATQNHLTIVSKICSKLLWNIVAVEPATLGLCYQVLNELNFDYLKKNGGQQRMTFMIEDDGLETLQLKSSGVWPSGKMGQKQVMTLYLTRVGP